MRIRDRRSLVLRDACPDCGHYSNESVFLDIQPAKRVVIQHVSEPKFELTIELSPSAAGTVVTWSQAFENAELAQRIEDIVVPANEQNLDRLAAEVAREDDRII